MKNFILIIAVVALALASACSSGGGTSPAAGPTPTQAGTPARVPPTANPTTAAAELSASACTVVSTVPTPAATEASLFPPPGESDWTLGPASAKMTIIEYSDFQCAKCAQQRLVLEQLVKDEPQDFRLVYRHYPLSQDDKSLLAAQAAEAAGLQHKFWEMHDLLYAQQAQWSAQTPSQFETWLVDQAKTLGLDQDVFQTGLKSQAIADRLKKDQEFGVSVNIPWTPFLLINGKIYTGPSDYVNLSNLLKVIQLQERQYTVCPPMTIDPKKQYLATLKTAKGEIVIQLFADKAPYTVNNFVFLAKNHWYDGITFHRVVTTPDVAQAGDPTATGWGGPGYAFKDEISPSLKFDRPGMVGMANSGPNTNGSQFFIARSAISYLDGKYPIFGQVIKGLDVVQNLAPRDPAQGGNLPPGDKILSVTIEEK